MLKSVLVGVVVLAAMGSSLACAETIRTPAAQRVSAEGGPVVTGSHIARLKSALKLTAAQVQHWAPVEAALRDIARRQAQAQTVDSSAVQRLMFAAMPLIQSLNDSQKHQAVVVVRSMGFTTVASMI